MTKVIIISLIALFPPIVMGGHLVNKCIAPDGTPVYQQNPCNDGSGTELKIETGSPSQSRKATQEEIDECLNLITIRYAYKDPKSVRVEGTSLAVVYPSGRKEIMLSINGRNSYGAYAGAKPAVCKYKANGNLESLKAF